MGPFDPGYVPKLQVPKPDKRTTEARKSVKRSNAGSPLDYREGKKS